MYIKMYIAYIDYIIILTVAFCKPAVKLQVNN